MAKYRIQEVYPGSFRAEALEWSGDLTDSDGMYWQEVTNCFATPLEAKNSLLLILKYRKEEEEFQERARRGQTTVEELEL